MDFEQKVGIEQRNGKSQKREIKTNGKIFLILSKMANFSNETEKPKQKNCNKPRKISDFEQNNGINKKTELIL